MDQTRLLSVDEVGERLGLTKWQVYRRIERGDIPARITYTPQRRYLVPEDQLAAISRDLTPPTADNHPVMTVSEVAAMTKMTAEYIRTLCRIGLLPASRGEGNRTHYRIPRTAVEAFFQKNQ